MLDVIKILSNYKRVSIIGMEKNVGKTTVLNYLINKIEDRKVVGLTSIGRDGEEVDVVTSTSKPRIFVYPNTIIATAKDCLGNCDITREILYTTDFLTPMGNIVIVRAISAGYVDIAGPSYNTQLKEVLDVMEDFGSDIILVDGALSRKGCAVSDVTEATILSTGAALSLDMGKVIDETKTTVSMLQLPELQEIKLKRKIERIFKNSRMAVMYEGEKLETLDGESPLESVEEIKSYLNDKLKVIAVRGAVTQKFLETLIKNRENYKKITLVIKDGTRIFTDFVTLRKMEACGIELKVLNAINLLFVTCNPQSPLGYEFPKEKFRELLEEKLRVDVIDVVGEKL